MTNLTTARPLAACLTMLTIFGLCGCGSGSTGAPATAPAGLTLSGTPGKGERVMWEKIGLAMIRAVYEETVKVDEKYAKQFAALLESPGTGLARILQRGRFDGLDKPRGGGAYYSFATRSHSYDDEPDLGLEQGYLKTSFYGGTTGAIVDIGVCDIATLDETLASRPKTMTEAQEPVWRLLTKDVKTSKTDFDGAFHAQANALDVGRHVKAVVGNTYLVRSIMPGEHDHLAAFTILDEDADGLTFVWRILNAWIVPKR